METAALAMLTALLLDGLFGWPDALFRRVGHPVTWIGALIARLDARADRRGDRGVRAGAMAAAVTLTATGAVALALTAAIPPGPWHPIAIGILAWPLLAARSLHDHVRDVAEPLSDGDTDAARAAVARIVGRDPAWLDEPAIARAAIESLAENTSDGVTAPLFWGLILGLPGIAVYKAINTLDSMIGYRNDRYLTFGRAAARLDDAANWLPARLTGLGFCAVARHSRRAFAVMRRDARAHRSPNAGWPEAAMAGALNVRLSGPRQYGDRIAEDPWLNPTAPDPAAAEIGAALGLFRRLMLGVAAVLALMAMV